MKSVLIASDHGGFELKEQLKTFLEKKGYQVDDLGVHSLDSVDYPDVARQACAAYKEGEYLYGVLICGTGIGISIAANKVEGIRCALPQNSFSAQMAREHNNANFIAFGGRVSYGEPVESILDAFDTAQFSTDLRHHRRVDKIEGL